MVLPCDGVWWIKYIQNTTNFHQTSREKRGTPKWPFCFRLTHSCVWKNLKRWQNMGLVGKRLWLVNPFSSRGSWPTPVLQPRLIVASSFPRGIGPFSSCQLVTAPFPTPVLQSCSLIQNSLQLGKILQSRQQSDWKSPSVVERSCVPTYRQLVFRTRKRLFVCKTKSQ